MKDFKDEFGYSASAPLYPNVHNWMSTENDGIVLHFRATVRIKKKKDVWHDCIVYHSHLCSKNGITLGDLQKAIGSFNIRVYGVQLFMKPDPQLKDPVTDLELMPKSKYRPNVSEKLRMKQLLKRKR